MKPEEILRPGQTVRFRELPPGVDALPDGAVVRIQGEALHVVFPRGQLCADSDRLFNREITMAWDDRGREESCPVLVEEVRGDGLRARLQVEQRRQFLRVPIRLSLRYEIIPPERLEEAKNRVLSSVPAREDLEIEVDRFWHSDDLGENINQQFSQMTRYVEQLDSKLDYLIALAEGRETARPVTYAVHLLDISGSGLGFQSREAINSGAHLRMWVELSRFPLSEVMAIGCVARCGLAADPERAGHYDIAVEFTTLHEDDREKIFRFISRAERRMLRERKELMNP